jgi:alpha-N-arabinofuranosidase
VVNRDEDKAISTSVLLQSGAYAGNATITELNGASVTAGNTPASAGVAPSTREIQFSGNAIQCSFPAHSFTQLVIPVK